MSFFISRPKHLDKDYNLGLYYNRTVGVGLGLWPITRGFAQTGWLTSRQSLAWDPSGFAYYNLNTSNILSDLLECNPSHVQISIKNYSGYGQGFESSISMDYGSSFTDDYNTFDSPQYNNYSFDFGVNSNGLKVIIESLLGNGIDIDLYYNIGRDINARGGWNTTSGHPSKPAWDTNDWRNLDVVYVNYVISRIKEAIEYFNIPKLKNQHRQRCFSIWCDLPDEFPRAYIETLYNGIKDAYPYVLLMANYKILSGTTQPGGTSDSWPGTIQSDEFWLWPFDILIYQRDHYNLITDPNVFDKIKSQLGESVNLGHEVMTSVLSTAGGGADYFAYDAAGILKTQTLANTLYSDIVTTKGAAITFNLCPNNDSGENENGTYKQTHIDLIKNIPR